MKKIIILVCVFQVFYLFTMCQTPMKIEPVRPIIQNTQFKLKGSVPFFARNSTAIKLIVPVGSANPTFKVQRGTEGASKNVTNTQSPGAPDENGRYCTTSDVSEEKGEYTKIVLGNQNDKIYPGAIYYETSFTDGTYNAPTDLQLQGYDITTDLFSAAFSGSSIVHVTPDLGGVNDGIGTLMRKGMRVKNPANVAVKVEQLNTSEQLAFNIGANFTGYGADLNASFNYLKSSGKTIFIAKLTQVYFSVMLNRANGSSLVSNNPLPNNLVYVNKVNYGRLGYILIASDSSREAIQATLDVAYHSGSVGGGVNAGLSYQRTMSSMQVSGFFFGGDAANTMTINSPNQLQTFDDYVQGGLRLDPNVAPVAVSYELKYLNDNASAATKSTTHYTERQCVSAKGIKIQFHNVAIEDVHGGDCSYAWGKVAMEIWETNAQRQPVRKLWNGIFWDYPDGRNPNRTVINFADIRANNTIRPEIRDLPNGVKTVTLNPNLVNDNKIMVRFIVNINTNHKDNDFAALGFHGMGHEEVVDRMLPEVFASSDAIQSDSKYKYGTFRVGRFCSNTDRVHCFYALFTITNN